MSEQVRLHGDIQRALIEANEVCDRFRFYSDGSVWEVHPAGWVRVGVLPRTSDRAALLWGRLDAKAGKS